MQICSLDIRILVITKTNGLNRKQNKPQESQLDETTCFFLNDSDRKGQNNSCQKYSPGDKNDAKICCIQADRLNKGLWLQQNGLNE